MYKLKFLSAFILIITTSCMQQSAVPQESIFPAITESYTGLSDDSPSMQLAGVDRSVFSNELEVLRTPIDCVLEGTGPTYREQSDINKSGKINYIRATVTLPDSKIIRVPDEMGKKDADGNIINYRIVSNVYTGGDTSVPNGALDVGFNSDDRLGASYWRAFIKPQPTAVFSGDYDKGANEPFLYRFKGGTTVDFVMYIDENQVIHFITRADMLVFKSIADRNPTTQKITREITVPSNTNTWSYEGLKQVFKVMTTVAVDRPSDLTSSKETTFPSASWGKIIVGFKDKKLDKQPTLDRIMDVLPQQFKNWADVLYTKNGNPCSSPSDMVIPTSTNSATISLRIRSKYQFSLVDDVSPIGKTDETKENKFVIKNVGPAGSILYYDFTPKVGPRQTGKLAANQTKQSSVSHTCKVGERSKPESRFVYENLNVYYSENETIPISPGKAPDKLPLNPGGILSWSNSPGNIIFN